MAAKNAKTAEPSFEEALNELESIVRLLEEGNLTLDEALAKFEKGILLSRLCSKKLEQAEKKIDMLLATEEGEIILKPMDLTGDRDE